MTVMYTGMNGNGKRKKEFMNEPMVTRPDTILRSISFQRHVCRPFFISEWDVPWPNEWRAESPIFLAAIGRFKWSGFAIHIFIFFNERNTGNRQGGKFSSDRKRAVPGRSIQHLERPLSMAFSPLRPLMRRGDVKVANKSYGIKTTIWPPIFVIFSPLAL